ncbi:trypsin-like serine protease [Amycolatopsis sp. RM579]|uniref:Trypsin-like serine protease n=2 Tax=Amycolatopsis pithecellobii TaxID=664692 RepID=A0A6N7Z191_9PSEU|nr:trypsin-like serine protease [Amycolatopsis pithecellobii]
MLGAGAAFAYVSTQQVDAADRKAPPVARAAPPSSGAPTPPPSAAPAVAPVLPFNAKLTSADIPVAGGGVRAGGCSGSLIDPHWVITAGHCFHDVNGVRVGGKPQYTMNVTVGKTKDSEPGGTTVRVVDVRQSPVNDLAVVKLSAPVSGIVPLTLVETRPAPGQRLEFAGWGSTSATVVSSSDHLKRGVFTVSKVNESTLDAVPVVARTVENSPCHDDSGAPFFITDDGVTGRLVAIEDSGPECPQPGTEILARVDVVAAWIHQQLSS